MGKASEGKDKIRLEERALHPCRCQSSHQAEEGSHDVQVVARNAQVRKEGLAARITDAKSSSGKMYFSVAS
jgi:hypothetical protein